MVHRDLNPNNLMLVGGQANTTLAATVKILDIGMGRTLFDESARSPAPRPADHRRRPARLSGLHGPGGGGRP